LCRHVSETYIWETAGDAYSCLARKDRINPKTKMLVIIISDRGLEAVVINHDHTLIKRVCQQYSRQKQVIKPKFIDCIKVNHEEDLHMFYENVPRTDNMSEFFEELLESLLKKGCQVYQLESTVWERIKDEKRQNTSKTR
jgi:hypothetical protein